MMIDEALAETIPEIKSIKQVPLLEATFDLVLESQRYEGVIARLYPECIILCIKKSQRPVYLQVNFTFDLIFSFMRDGEDQFSGNPIQLKFERFDKFFILRNESLRKELFEWKEILEQKLNQRGFHELFKPMKKIGKGNFASVFLVIKNQNGKSYAVKAFSKEAAFGEDKGKESLVNQINVMRNFNHKNLMKLYGVYESVNSIYVSVELLQGGQLYDKIKNKHRFNPAEVKTVMKGILEGLEVMHAKNIMHRDLKPENILLRKDNDFDCVIADFGLAEDCTTKDYIFVRCGTPGYVAPEVVNLKDLKAKYSPICDLFSVGVIFHLLALRKSPFPGREYDEVLNQNRECKFNFEAAEYSALDETWLDLLKRLLEKDPKKRINATDALNHQFFTKDTMFASFVNQRHSAQLEEVEKRHSIECQSPLMLTKDCSRKHPARVREDSCLKFKMKENVMTGRTDEKGETFNDIDSPLLRGKTGAKNPQSRFKRMVVQRQ